MGWGREASGRRVGSPPRSGTAKRLGLCTQEQAILRDGMRMPGESVRRLVDTHHPLIRVLFGQQGRAHARAAEGIENERPWLALVTCQKLLEGPLRVLRAGFSPGILLVMLDDLNQIRMRRHLVGSQHIGRIRCSISLRSHSHLAIITRNQHGSGERSHHA